MEQLSDDDWFACECLLEFVFYLTCNTHADLSKCQNEAIDNLALVNTVIGECGKSQPRKINFVKWLRLLVKTKPFNRADVFLSIAEHSLMQWSSVAQPFIFEEPLTRLTTSTDHCIIFHSTSKQKTELFRLPKTG